jgi:hypothetical protein
MNLAILHYHLDPGGVTRVIENHLLALAASEKTPRHTAILYGGRAGGWPTPWPSEALTIDVTQHAIPHLEYDDGCAPQPHLLADAIRQSLESLNFRPHDTILHVHNHALGKNLSLPGALQILASEGWRLLLQIHDFVEDFRPANFRRIAATFGPDYAAALYPQAPQIHYALLNRRDYELLATAGFAPERICILPNPTPERAAALPDRHAAREKLERRFHIPSETPFVLYPVRGIRRKNVGELLLLSLLDEESFYGLTLVPVNPAERAFHDRWRTFANHYDLPVRFATGEPAENGLNLVENLAAADAVVTTSVAEGFGMAFLEPWLVGKPLGGRDLPAITADFKSVGVRFESLYDRLHVPLDWVGADRYAPAVRAAGEALLAAYHRPPLPWQRWREILDAKTAGGMVDFGDLNEGLQQRVLQRLASSSAARDELRVRNPKARRPHDEGFVDQNAAKIRTAFGTKPSGQRLIDAYHRLLHAPVEPIMPPPRGNALLDCLLDLEHFRLIRSLA